MKILVRALSVSTAQRRYFLSTLVITFMLLACFGLSAQAAPGDLDLTFDSDGKVTTNFFNFFERVQAVTIQPDGKIVAAGYAYDGTGVNFALARYNADGSLDTSFDVDGKVTTNFQVAPNSSGSSDYGHALALQPDGKIIVAGEGGGGFGLARFNLDGSLDAGFGTGGKVITNFNGSNGFSTGAFAVAIQGDGKIVAAGTTSFSVGSYDFAVVRYNMNGTLDNTFDHDGKAITDFFGGQDQARAVVIQPNGKIVVAGTASLPSEPGQFFAVARYNINGSLDTTFDGDGKTTTNAGAVAWAVALQPDGKIVTAGNYHGSGFDFGLARFNVDGSLDSTFDGDGKVQTSFSGTFSGDDYAFATVVQPNGKIIAAGYGSPNANTNFALARYNADGALDSTFGNGGQVVTPFDLALGSNDVAYAVALQPDGKIIAAGSSALGGGNLDFALVRYQGDAVTASANGGNVLISEFRLRGTQSANDEFVELYNNTDINLVVTTSDGSAGWSLVASDGVTRFIVPFNTVIPARGHYLATNSSGYNLADYPATRDTTATPDRTFSADIVDNTGIVLYRTADPANFTPANALDAVGFGITPAPYSEGVPLLPVGTTSSGEYSFVRKVPNANGIPQDTNNNAADFMLVATDAGTYGTQTATLGSPGPENRSSPVVNNKIAVSLVDPLTSRLSGANFVRNGSGNSGTFAIRRHFTNQTGAPITRLRFRVYDITTLNTPVLSPPQADLRLTGSPDEMVSATLGMVTVKGTQLEQPPLQALGGGLNTSMTVQLPTGGLANGDSLDVQFLLNVVVNGRFRFFFTVEALP